MCAPTQDVRKVKNEKVGEEGGWVIVCAKGHFSSTLSKSLNHAVFSLFSSLQSITQTQIILIYPLHKYTFIFLHLLTVFLSCVIIQSNIKIVPFKIPSFFLFSKSNFFLKMVPVFQIATAQQPQGLRGNFFQNFVPILVPKKYYIYKYRIFLGVKLAQK